MPSVLPGFEYDIFISYRQKDNKGERWVSEFVEALKTEIESTFKEDISVYFDENPHDGLLETHDVDASLKDKLKCLVFIPILSRTFCDPKAFAWDHEFKAFVDQASRDPFGLKIKLPSRNVANRVLPVRINDLDEADIKLCESLLGGVLRSIDFIYKSPGVNRPLRSKEDNPHDNLNHTIYRDQINKIALAIKDIIESMKVTGAPVRDQTEEIRVGERKKKQELIIDEAVAKEKGKSKQERLGNQTRPFNKEKSGSVLRKPQYMVPGTLMIITVIVTWILVSNHRSKVRWAKEKALPEIEQLINEARMVQAFDLVQQAGKYISTDPEFKKLESTAVKKMTILTDPPGALVSTREYSDTAGVWKVLGKTPIEKIRMPSTSFYLMRFEKTGFENVLAVAPTWFDTISRILFREGTIPPDMVYVEGFFDGDKNILLKKEENGFFLDRYEVTNKQYKEFMDNGGFSNPLYWKEEFIKEGKTLSRNDAMAEFVDKTGRPGPATWEAGDYPDGQDNYPVSGVSWYEAAAYAEYAGKCLPTGDHWYTGTARYLQPFLLSFGQKIFPFSNFNGKGPEPVGKDQGMNNFGAYDMAGNMREWCWNRTRIGRIICGGAWDDVNYMYTLTSQLPPFNRSPKNGFRCAKYIDKGKVPEQSFRQIDFEEPRDYSFEKPVPDNIFLIYKNQFSFDKINLNERIEDKDETPKDWTVEKVSFSAAYENDRVIAYLFLPRAGSPPYQTLIFFPGSGAESEKDLKKSSYANWDIDFILKNGRAIMFPVYKGTYERIENSKIPSTESHSYVGWLVKWSQDVSRSIDYLETRQDIDRNKIGFYGRSWGGIMGGIIPAVENRIKLIVLAKGGFGPYSKPYPEADQLNYVSRITQPILMLNGRFDTRFPLEAAVKPFYKLLGTPPADKRIVIYDTDHFIAKSDMIKEILGWLDKYFGPAK